jgi:putative photosynthetic complex assembly protein
MSLSRAEAKLVTRDREMIPTVLLRAMLALVVAALCLAAYASLTERPLEAMPAMVGGDVPVVRERLVILDADGVTGAARVLDENGAVIANLDPTQGGFVAGVHRALSFVRDKQGVPETAPLRLVLFENGQLSLRDDATGWRAELIGFGASNAATFMSLLD